MKKHIFSIILLFCLIMVGCSTNKNDTSNSNQQNSISHNYNQDTNEATSRDGGFDFDDLISSLKSAGYISNNGTAMDLSELGAIKAVRYDNLLIVQFDVDNNNSYFTIYDEGKITINGKELQVGGIIGPYMLFFFNNQINQDAVKIFQAVGGF